MIAPGVVGLKILILYSDEQLKQPDRASSSYIIIIIIISSSSSSSSSSSCSSSSSSSNLSRCRWRFSPCCVRFP